MCRTFCRKGVKYGNDVIGSERTIADGIGSCGGRGGICYFRGFSHGMEKAMEEIQNIMNQFIEINLGLIKKHFGEEGENEKDNV